MKTSQRTKLPFGSTVKKGILVDGISTRNPVARYDTLAVREGLLKQRILERNPRVRQLLEEKKLKEMKKKADVVKPVIGFAEAKQLLSIAGKTEVKRMLDLIGKEQLEKLVKSAGSGRAVGELVKNIGTKLIAEVLRKEKNPKNWLTALKSIKRQTIKKK